MQCNRNALGRSLQIGIVLSALVGMCIGARAASFQTLFSFDGQNEGGNPYYAGVVRDPVTGNLYGTTYSGRGGRGVVFQLASDGTETVLYAFGPGGDGTNPASGVIRDRRGNLYGTTTKGGAHGAGAVFKITTKGKEKLIHSFDFTGGATPMGSMIFDDKGNLYGTTWGGGNVDDGCCGTIFKITRTGTFKVLYNFFFGIDGYENTGIGPEGGLTIDSEGQLYGTTYSGGEILGVSNGTVFRLSPKGVITVLHSFTSGTDGAHPHAGVIEDSSGNFYGTTEAGGKYGLGTVYKLTRSGNNYVESVLYSFTGQDDGKAPDGPLYLGASGTLYGTTGDGGDPNYCRCGVVFKLAPNGSYTALHQFTYATDGGFPHAGLIADGQGNLFSTADGGGAGGAGTVFKLTD